VRRGGNAPTCDPTRMTSCRRVFDLALQRFMTVNQSKLSKELLSEFLSRPCPDLGRDDLSGPPMPTQGDVEDSAVGQIHQPNSRENFPQPYESAAAKDAESRRDFRAVNEDHSDVQDRHGYCPCRRRDDRSENGKQ